MLHPRLLKTADLVKATGLSRMHIGRLANAGEIPGACRAHHRANWSFADTETLRAWLKWTPRDDPWRAAVYSRQSRRAQRLLSFESHLDFVVKAVVEGFKTNPEPAAKVMIDLLDSFSRASAQMRAALESCGMTANHAAASASVTSLR